MQVVLKNNKQQFELNKMIDSSDLFAMTCLQMDVEIKSGNNSDLGSGFCIQSQVEKNRLLAIYEYMLINYLLVKNTDVLYVTH